ncbi:MAG: heat-inducible transcription repressor HrcA [Acidimicrobiaceae bacterium]|nr:heat-inducible transcription repressor HrcA [Acidimicrobiaceae bacterium]
MARRGTSRNSGKTDLDARKATILEAVVAEHIDTAQPVGSSAVAQHADLGVSPATVRNEMVSLERGGYLAQPHTSAGRIPTDKGYRYFVDHLQSGELKAAQQYQLRDFFSGVRGEVEEVLERTSALLAQLSGYTSVIVGTTATHSTVLSVQLVNLERRHQLLVTVFSDGTVLKHSVVTTEDIEYATCLEASAQLNALLIGTTLESRVQVPSRSDSVSHLIAEAVSVLHAERPTREDEKVFIGGASKVAEVFDGVETVRQVLSILEEELLVVSLVEDMLDRGVSVAIGSEHGYAPLSSAAVVVAPVHVDGVAAGAVGLIGPTRMKYQEVMAAATAVSKNLARHFEGGASAD